MGAARVVLETGDHPALLKDSVTTPAGCTIDAIMELEEGKLRATLIKAVVKATQRAGELLFEKHSFRCTVPSRSHAAAPSDIPQSVEVSWIALLRQTYLPP